MENQKLDKILFNSLEENIKKEEEEMYNIEGEEIYEFVDLNIFNSTDSILDILFKLTNKLLTSLDKTLLEKEGISKIEAENNGETSLVLVVTYINGNIKKYNGEEATKLLLKLKSYLT